MSRCNKWEVFFSAIIEFRKIFMWIVPLKNNSMRAKKIRGKFMRFCMENIWNMHTHLYELYSCWVENVLYRTQDVWVCKWNVKKVFVFCDGGFVWLRKLVCISVLGVLTAYSVCWNAKVSRCSNKYFKEQKNKG